MPDRLTGDRRQEIFGAALRLMAVDGFDRVSMDHIAREAHASTATLYRRWGSKERLVIEALQCVDSTTNTTLSDTGSFGGDLHAAVEAAAGNGDDLNEIVGALQFAASRDLELSEAFRGGISARIGTLLTALVERAVQRGEFDHDHPAIRYLQLLLLAPAVLSPLVDEFDSGGMHRYIDSVILPAFGLPLLPTPLTPSSSPTKVN